MRWKIRLLLIGFWILGVALSRLNAQSLDYHIQKFDYSLGIRPGNIIALQKDSKGFLWILSGRMVQRFDGRDVTNFKPAIDLTQILCDNNGVIWVGSNKKIYQFNEAIQVFEEVPIIGPENKKHTLGTLSILPDNRIMLSTANELFELNRIKRQFEISKIRIPGWANYGTHNFCSFKNSLFFQRGKFIFKYHLLTQKLDSIENPAPRFIFPLTEDSVIVSSWTPQSYWNNFKDQSLSAILSPGIRDLPQPNQKFFNVRSLTSVDSNLFFLTSTIGVFQYNLKTQKFLPVNFFEEGIQRLTADYTNYLYCDSDRFLWFTTASAIARFPVQGQFFGLRRNGSQQMDLPITVDNIRGIAGDGENSFWFATANGFVHWKRNINKWQVYLPIEGRKDGLSHPSIRGIAWDGKYVILGPTDYGIWLFDPIHKKYKRPFYENNSTKKVSEQDFIDGITTLKNGNHVITGRDALYVLDGRTYQLRKFNTQAGRENSNFCFQSPNGKVWITTNNGLHLFDENLRYLRQVPVPKSGQMILAGFPTKDNKLLFSMNDGVYIASITGEIASVTKFSNVFDDLLIFSLYQDEQGFVWATSDNGIYRYDTLTKRLTLFDYTDNIQGYGFNLNSYYRTADGMLFLGGTNGLNYLNPTHLSKRVDKLKVFIFSVKLFNDSLVYDINSINEIPYHQRVLEVTFAAPYFNNASKLNYRYRFIGQDKEWKYLGNNPHLRFSTLNPGRYQLQVQASINNIDWVDAHQQFSFIIKKPFWLSWWFIFMLIFIVAAIVFLVIHVRMQKLRQKAEEREVEYIISSFTTSMYQQHTVEQLFWDVVKNCIGRLNFEDCVIYAYCNKKNVLVQKAAYGDKAINNTELYNPIEIPLGQGITGTVAQTHTPIIVTNTLLDSRYIVDDKRRLSEIAVPILADGKLLGVIDCEHSKKGFFTQKHLIILQTIATLCAGRISKINAEMQRAEAEKSLMATRQKMAEVEMQALRAQMNPHFIFNCLNSINRYIVKSDSATASLYLTRFSKLIRLILDNSNNSSISLASEVEALKLYIEMESIRFQNKFSYEIYLDKEVNADSIQVPPLIIQPFVENAIWHGLLHSEEAGMLYISIKKSNETLLTCMVEDNGVGREKARAIKRKSATSKKSLGMKLTKERLELLNRHSLSQASVKIIDLYNPIGEATGTRVVIQIPIND